MNIRNYSILIRASDLQASSLRIDRPGRCRRWPFRGDCSPLPPPQQTQQPHRLRDEPWSSKEHVPSNNLSAGGDRSERGGRMCGGRLHPDVKLQTTLNSQ